MENSSPTPSHKQNTVMAVVAYLFFFIPLLTGDSKKDPYVNFHTKQGLVLFLLAVIVNIAGAILPWTLQLMVSPLLGLGLLILLVIGILNAINGKKTPLPLVGQYADKFNF